MYSQDDDSYSTALCALEDSGCPTIDGFTQTTSFPVSQCSNCFASTYLCCKYANSQYTTSICSSASDGCAPIPGYDLTSITPINSCSSCQ